MTSLVKPTTENLSKAAKIINDGGLVAFPTETVYGLGADGLNETAVKKIYVAKGRPSDNPLILHIQDKKEVLPLVLEINETAKKLMDTFWPGPMTLVFKKSAIVPSVISGGLDTVAIRLPENEIARELIALAKKPIAAPSANTSGKPSPTKASHVFDDLNNKIDMIIDGGSCNIGLESTVIDVTTLSPVILRPGGVTFEDIFEIFPDVTYDKHLTLDVITDTVQPKSPGMKYKHYAPKGELYILDGNLDEIKSYIGARYDTSKIFGDTPIANGMMTRIIVCIVTYRAIRRNAARKVPDDYSEMQEWAYGVLEKIRDGIMTLPDAPLAVDPDTGEKLSLFGSNRKPEYFL